SYPRVTRNWSAAKMWSRPCFERLGARRSPPCGRHRRSNRPHGGLLRSVAAAILVASLAGCASAPRPAEGEAAAAGIPAEARTRFEEATSIMAAGDLTEAELRLEAFVLEYPDYPGAWVDLAILHSAQDD